MGAFHSNKYKKDGNTIDTYDYVKPAISGGNGEIDAVIDRLYRFLFPIRSKSHLLNVQSQQDNRSKYLTLPHGSIFHCSLPYSEKVGLIGPNDRTNEV